MDPLSPQDQDLLTRTVLSEAGQDGMPGMAAVASVIRNRVASGQYGADPSDVVLAPKQFSSWSLPGNDPDSPSRWKSDSPQYQQASQIVNSVWSGKTSDPTGGADHYLNPKIVQAQNGSLPEWAQGQPTAQIGGHAFYASPQAAPSMIALPSSSDIAATRTALGIPQFQAVSSSGPGPTVMLPTGGSPTGSPSPTVPAATATGVPATGYAANVTPDDIAATAKMLGVSNAPGTQRPSSSQFHADGFTESSDARNASRGGQDRSEYRLSECRCRRNANCRSCIEHGDSGHWRGITALY